MCRPLAARIVTRCKSGLTLSLLSFTRISGPIFRPTTPDAYKQIAKENIAGRFKWVDEKLTGKQYLMGDVFTAPDAYLYVMTRWAKRIGMELDQWPRLKAFSERVEARPKVQETLKAEGLV